MRIEDVLHSSLAIDRIQKRKQSETKTVSSKVIRRYEDDVGVLRQTDEKLMAIRDREQNFMRHEMIVSGLEVLKKRVSEFSRLSPEQRNYEAFSQELQQLVSQTRFQGETPLAYLSLRVHDDKALYTLGQQIDQEMMVHQARLKQERKQLAAFLVTQENQDALQGRSAEALVSDLKQVLQNVTEYPSKRDHSFVQIIKIL